MKFDVVFVTYNSESWLDNCLKSIEQNNFDLKKISLYFADNNSTDNTVSKINEYINSNKEKFDNLELISLKKNKGFGYGNNKAAALGKNKYIFFLNVDTELPSNVFNDLSKAIEDSSDEIGIFELAQMPYEHPKYYNPLTWETPWASGACMVIRRDIFEKCKGFDTNIFMYCEDVELSLHVRMLGYKIKYLPNIAINHYSYKYPGEEKPISKYYSPANNYYLRCKYGNFKDRCRGYRAYRNFFRMISFSEKRYVLIKFCKMFFSFIKARLFRNDKKFKPEFKDLDYSDTRRGPFYVKKKITTNPKVSIIIRTHNRPDVLKETLYSLRNQTYKNFEVCIVEDGNDTCSKMLKKEFSDLDINYYATGEHVGRCEVANIGMERSKGKYINFLDDDDLFFADHIEVMVGELEANNYNVVFSQAMEERIDIYDKENYKYRITNRFNFERKYFKQTDIFNSNCFPIQSVMFNKKVLDKMLDDGKFDVNIDCLEDWDFWIRMGLLELFHCIDKTTSVYRVPNSIELYNVRKEKIDSFFDYIYLKYKKKKINISLEMLMDTRNL